MSRRVLKPAVVKKPLGELLDEYYDIKSVADKAKKETDALNKEIKEEMLLFEVDEFDNGRLKATITIIEGTNFDEIRAIEILKESLTKEQLDKVVKTREYLDSEALEDLIYRHEFDASILNPCTSPKEPSYRLKVTKSK